MPPRNVVPKPLQKPHPPLWVACSRRETIRLAAEKGIGALSFSFVEPEEAAEWVDEYHAIIASERCVPGRVRGQPAGRRRAADDVPSATRPRRSSAASTARTSSATRSRTTTSSAITGRGARTSTRSSCGAATRSASRASVIRAQDAPLGRPRPAAGPRLAARRDRHAGPGPRPVPPLRGRRRRPGHLRPAGRAQPARAHLRVARDLRGRGAPRVRRRSRRHRRAHATRELAGAIEAALQRRRPPRVADAGLHDRADRVRAARRAAPSARRPPRPAATPARRAAARREGPRRAGVPGVRPPRRATTRLERTAGSEPRPAGRLRRDGPGLRARARERLRRRRCSTTCVAATAGSCSGRSRSDRSRRRARPGPAAAPALTLKLTVADFLRMAARDLDAGQGAAHRSARPRGRLLARAAARRDVRPAGGALDGGRRRLGRERRRLAAGRSDPRWRDRAAIGRRVLLRGPAGDRRAAARRWRGRDCRAPRSATRRTASERVVLVLLDAFGWRFFTRHADRHPLLRRFLADGTVAKLTTQFPSTTAAHVTTLHTGRPVAEHGVYEWNIYEPSIDALVTPLMFSFAGDGERDTLRRRGRRPAAPCTRRRRSTAAWRPAACGASPSIRPRSRRRPTTASSRRRRAASVRDPRRRLRDHRRRARAGNGPTYTYVYIDTVDATGHQLGPSSEAFDAEATRCLDAIEAATHGAPGRARCCCSPPTTARSTSIRPGPASSTSCGPGIGAHLRRDTPRPSDRSGGLGARPLPPHRAGLARGTSSTGCARCSARTPRSTPRPTSSPRACSAADPARACGRGSATSACCPAPGETVWWRERGRFGMRFRGHHGGLTPDEAHTLVASLVVA